MSINASDVKSLREKTGAGMMDCKRALVEAQGDFDKAERILKEMGLAQADKRASRSTNEGRIFSRVENNRGILLELSCETDFVARNSDFIELGNSLIDTILHKGLMEATEELENRVKDTMSRIKENMGLKRFKVLGAAPGEHLVDYIHGDGRIGVLVKFRLSDPALKDHPKFGETAFDFALHVAAYAPLFLSREAIDTGYIAEQEILFKKQTDNDPKNQGKPDNVIESIVKGKLSKHLAGICLLDQGFVKEEKVKNSKILENLGKEIGGRVEITDFQYFKVGVEI
ncbi:MAG TPA: translation elongation factor Ts [Spirochaetia bacterium]|nr:translation elongation factor Ts [Spirochaetia bacterium]